MCELKRKPTTCELCNEPTTEWKRIDGWDTCPKCEILVKDIKKKKLETQTKIETAEASI